MAVTTVRQRVLAYFQKSRAGSAREVSRALKLSPATVRHHLRVLVSDGRLEIASTRSRQGLGRPEKVYSVPRAALGDNLPALAEALWAESGLVGVEVLARRLVGEAGVISQSASKRVNLVVEKLNEMKYHARWEAGAGGPRIIFGHCPYAALIAKRPELCRMDAALLEELMGSSADTLSTIKDRSASCVFAMGR